MTDAVVRAAYTVRAEEYAALLGSTDAAAEEDRRLVARWAARIPGRVVDAGCGPGHWTDFLAAAGADVEGVDLTPAFVAIASARYPSRRFRVAAADDLGLADGAVSGVLAWYSLIHLEPARVTAALAEFARCLIPGGGLLLGCFEGPRLETFPHAVTPAYFWPVDALVRQVERAGFAVDEVHTRTDPGRRPHAAVVAHRSATTRTATASGCRADRSP